MYENIPTSNLCYSPMPTRHYVRQATWLCTWPAKQALAPRDQAWWNLIWLASPEIDQVLQVVDESSHDRYINLTRGLIRSLYYPLRQLKKFQKTVKSEMPMEKALKTLPPESFIEYLEALQFMKAKVFKEHGRELFELMKARAKLSVSGKLYLLNAPDDYPYTSVSPDEYEKAIYPSVIARIRWLQSATDVLEEHIKSAGFTIPPVTFEMDSFSLQRNGVCHTSSEGEANRIGISPIYIDGPDVLQTLTHELVHAIDNCLHGHYGGFVKIATKIGLVGPGRSQRPDKRLKALFEEIRGELGPYPHFVVEFY